MTKESAKRQTEFEVKWVGENAQHPAIRGARVDPDGYTTAFHKAVVYRLDRIMRDPDKLKMLADIFECKPSRIKQWITKRMYKLRIHGGFGTQGCSVWFCFTSSGRQFSLADIYGDIQLACLMSDARLSEHAAEARARAEKEKGAKTTRMIREYIDAKKTFDRLDAGEKERALKANPDLVKCLKP